MTVVHTSPPPEPGMIAGRGAWSVWGHTTGSRYYLFKSLSTQDGKRTDTPEHAAVHHAVAGIQRSLNAVGYRRLGLPIPVTGVFGPRTMWGVNWYQKQAGLKIDGVFGPVTARSLFTALGRIYSAQRTVPASHVLGMIDLESGFDPGAVSTWYRPQNGPDRGLAQINQNAHREVLDPQAFDPLFALPYACKRLADARARFAGKGPELQDFCSIAQHNSPLAAQQWYEIGWVGEDEAIWLYVQRVLQRAQTFQ